jgi:hypothetical protein
MVTKILNWDEFRAMAFQKTTELVQKHNCSNFTLLGWKHLELRLILHFRDCDMVFDFKFNQIDEDHTNTDLDKQFEVTSFYTKDYTHEEFIDEMKHFESNWNRYLPEEK